MNLSTKIADLVGVGPIYVNRLKKLEIETVNDLLHHYPFRYDDYSVNTPIAQARIGEIVTIRGKIHSAQNDFTKNGKKLQKIQIFDGTGSMLLIFFNQPYLIQSMKIGDEMAASGTVTFFSKNKAVISPEYEMIYNRAPIHTGRIVPVYPETAGVSSKWLRSKIALILSRIGSNMTEYLPNDILHDQNLTPYQNALSEIHFPKDEESALLARQRLAFDELFLTLLSSQIRKRQWRKEITTTRIQVSKFKLKIAVFIKQLPFTLTTAQIRAYKEILNDLNESKPMNRLLQGDVGSGKTVVAAIALYVTYLAGYKSAIMAPTEILAEQHFKTIQKLFKPYNIAVKLITSSTSKNLKLDKKSSNFDIAIGTHALLYNQKIDKLALVVIDEQHRFGVEQRSKLKQQGIHPHLLSMTATPIPRSYALVLHSELDLSYIDEMPRGRKIIKTWLVPNEKRNKAYEWVRTQLQKSNDTIKISQDKNSIQKTQNQAFVICPLIEESAHETLQAVKAATVEYENLRKNIFPDLKLGLLHGKVKQKEKATLLENMAFMNLDILVATPVVEVGIDIPNATIMIIEAADRFGLAQLHQLRGRVGRNDRQSYCLLFTENESEKTVQRLKYLEKVNNGAELAKIDMQIRGAGDLYGIKQSGFSGFKLASLTDSDLITKARSAIEKVFQIDQTFGEINSKTNNDLSLLHERLQEYIIQDIGRD